MCQKSVRVKAEQMSRDIVDRIFLLVNQTSTLIWSDAMAENEEWKWGLCKNQFKLFNQSKVNKMKSMMINHVMKCKLMMKKVSQNLPMMPNFGGECKTTGL